MEYYFPESARFVCEKCGRCCGDTEDTIRHVLLLKSEAEKISKETSQEIREFAHEVNGFEPYIYEIKKTETEGKCLFLEYNRCTIYEIRPIICRFYPFELKNLGKDKYSFLFTTKCKGIGQGPNLKKDFFEGLFMLVTKVMDEDAKIA
ncbi:MAG: YkgJ family cysteine cluster protein [Candidatus Bathyarchaeota archaeon]|nr:YkgJ family cysteine cluster protein [Candidatus Bathyarchaeum tardum]WGM88609.1 MAG: YkgJ family cysteine cluster protein [Candidatus Bathyarchaeum tardum]WNZ29135.1 MAG: YkgJ family cysteine cluster protein [Candidatus Bathyarchaeota archaeon]